MKDGGVTRTGRSLAAATPVLLAAAVAAWVVLRPAAAPPEEEGKAWLSAFADRLTSPQSWNARGPAALALFPGFEPWSNTGCVTAWSRRDASAPVVTYQRLELGRLAADPCDQAQFGMLSTTLRQSEGITPGALVNRFEEQFGPPAVHRDTSLRGSISYRWLLQDGIFVQVEEPVGPGADGEFSVLFVRSYAAPTKLASPEEGEAWMDQAVALVAGPTLPAARGQAVVGMFGTAMQPQDTGDAGCATNYASDLLHKTPIVIETTLILERGENAPCAQARFSWMSMRVWQHEPVTAGDLAKRLDAKLGPAAVSRDFEHSSATYRWATPYGTSVELSETLSGDGVHWLGLRVWRA